MVTVTLTVKLKMYTEKKLQLKFGISANALKQRIKHLKLVPHKGDRGKNLYDESQLRLLESQHEHLAGGGLLDNFATPVSAEIVTSSSGKLAVVSSETTANFIQVYHDFYGTDPFYDYETLQRAANNSWHLPTEKLAVIIQKSPSSFTGLKSFIHQGFVIVRTSTKSGGSYQWSINANQ